MRMRFTRIPESHKGHQLQIFKTGGTSKQRENPYTQKWQKSLMCILEGHKKQHKGQAVVGRHDSGYWLLDIGFRAF